MSQLEQKQLLAALPAYNEEHHIGTVVLKIRKYINDVIVIDDGSTDQTSRVAELAGATVIRNEKNVGKGASLQKIFVVAQEKKADVLVILDADCQHDPDDIPAMMAPVLSENMDLVIGSRKAESHKTPAYRRFGQRVLLRSTKVLTKTNISDSECGFRALSQKAVWQIQLKENGFAVETEMLAQAVDRDLQVTEVPISNIYTGDGSTLHPVRHGLEVLTQIVNMISVSRPMLFFGFPGIIMIILGVLLGNWVVNAANAGGGLAYGRLMVAVLLFLTGVFSTFTGIILNTIARIRR